MIASPQTFCVCLINVLRCQCVPFKCKYNSVEQSLAAERNGETLTASVMAAHSDYKKIGGGGAGFFGQCFVFVLLVEE